MRIFFNILAWFVGLFCGLLAIGCCLAFARLVIAAFKDDSTQQPMLLPVLMALIAGLAWLSMLMAARAYRHVRQPDESTAKDVVGIATFLLAMGILSRLRKASIWPLSDGPYGSIIGLAVCVATVSALYLFYRLVLKRLVARAFPSPAPESHA